MALLAHRPHIAPAADRVTALAAALEAAADHDNARFATASRSLLGDVDAHVDGYRLVRAAAIIAVGRTIEPNATDADVAELAAELRSDVIAPDSLPVEFFEAAVHLARGEEELLQLPPPGLQSEFLGLILLASLLVAAALTGEAGTTATGLAGAAAALCSPPHPLTL